MHHRGILFLNDNFYNESNNIATNNKGDEKGSIQIKTSK